MGLGIRTALGSLKRRVQRTDEKILAAYLRSHTVRKLHVGCGTHIVPGWLNCDLASKVPGVFLLDATKRFPFHDNQFDFLFSEHLIEHLTYEQGRAMLSECFRVLKPGGVARITTPSFEFLADLYKKQTGDLEKAYIDWAAATFIPHAGQSKSVFVINNFLYCDWGHRFIYDPTTLSYALTSVGFTDARECALLSSSHEELRNLENHERMPAGFLALESMTVEATKPR